MAAYKTCKICGKEYEYCHTLAPKGVFRWQDVACSPEHAQKYFELIAISRGEAPEKNDAQEAPVVEVATADEQGEEEDVLDYEDDEEEDDEEDEYDDEEEEE